MIRSGLMKGIYEALGNKQAYLALEDFQTEEYKNSQDEPCLLIKYRYNPRWFFKFHIPKRRTKVDQSESYWFNCTMSPGRESVEETVNADERRGLLREIQEWTGRLYDDILAAPLVRQFEAHASALNQLKERLDRLPDQPLSDEDVAEFREGLDQLRTELSERLAQAVADKEDLKATVEELARDIDLLKQALASMTKRNWGELFIARIRKWQGKVSLRQIAAGARVARRLLPPGVSEEAGIVADVMEGLADALDKKPNTTQPQS